MSERSAEVRIEGYAPEEILALPAEELDELLRYNRPIVFRAGSATILAQVRVELGALVVEVAHVDGGGEDVLPAIWRVVTGLARRRPDVDRVEWIVHATRCANPNPALRRVLERKASATSPRSGRSISWPSTSPTPLPGGRVRGAIRRFSRLALRPVSRARHGRDRVGPSAPGARTIPRR